MADEKKPAFPPPDARPVNPEKQPIEKEKIHVTVVPKDPKNQDHKDYRDKIKPHIKEDVQKTLGDTKEGGAKKQLEGIEKKLDEIKKLVNPDKVKEIEIKIEGEVGGKPMKPHVTTVKPDEGGSAPKVEGPTPAPTKKS